MMKLILLVLAVLCSVSALKMVPSHKLPVIVDPHKLNCFDHDNKLIWSQDCTNLMVCYAKRE